MTTANAHDTQPVGALLGRAAQDGWGIKRPRVGPLHGLTVLSARPEAVHLAPLVLSQAGPLPLMEPGPS